ncbi:MAG: hypothetical protein PUD07_01345 [bacterium]|nr:hypothetical protein [bacterium]
MNNFITFGTKSLNPELFKKVLPYPDGSITKPIGGLWCTRYFSINANEWLMYLESKRSLFYSKFNGDACIINLKENANILYINTIDDFNNALKLYRLDNNKLDFQKLSNDYDGLFLNSSIIKDIGYIDWSISSLVLFNLECIKEYTPIEVEYFIEEYSIEYEIKKIEETRIIEKPNADFTNLYNLIKYEFEFNIHKDIFEYLEMNEYYNKLYSTIKNIIFSIIQNEEIIFKILESENLKFDKKNKQDIIDALTHKLFEEEFEKFKPQRLYYSRKLNKGD